MIKVITDIQFLLSDVFSSKGSVGNVISAVVNPTVPTIQDEMIVDHADSTSWVLDDTTGPAFDLDVMTLVNLGAPGDVKLIHIHCHKIIEEADDMNDPIRFEVELGGTSIGRMSQFQVANSDSFSPSTLKVKNVGVPSGQKALLVVVFALDK